MASDNLMAMEQPWTFRPSFADAWFAELARDTDTLSKALQRSIAASSSEVDGFSSEMVESLLAMPEVAPLQTPSASGGGSENEISTPKRRRALQPSGRVAKRKSRASKRSTTTFITADPANFRQMVQQVTGARFVGLDGQMPVAPVLKPEPRYGAVNRLEQGTGLPTLDTSAFFLDGAASSLVVPQPSPPPSVPLPVGGAAATGLNFDYSCSFPTLESWKVM